jgi:hypothetical protein
MARKIWVFCAPIIVLSARDTTVSIWVIQLHKSRDIVMKIRYGREILVVYLIWSKSCAVYHNMDVSRVWSSTLLRSERVTVVGSATSQWLISLRPSPCNCFWYGCRNASHAASEWPRFPKCVRNPWLDTRMSLESFWLFTQRVRNSCWLGSWLYLLL